MGLEDHVEHTASNDEAVHVDLRTPEILEALRTAVICGKTGTVEARRANPGDVLDTEVEGVIEVDDAVAREGDWQITNPDGSKYFLPDAKFSKKYRPSETEGVYEAVGFARAIQNPFGKRISITLDTGATEYGDADCYILDSCDAKGENMEGHPYIIARSSFDKTYSLF